MALKPQLYGSNGTFVSSQFVEAMIATSGLTALDDHIANSSASSITTRRNIIPVIQDGNSLEILVFGNTAGAANWAVINTTPVIAVTETDRIEDTTHSRGIQRFVIDNMSNANNFIVFTTWGVGTTQAGVYVRVIGNTSGSVGRANNWQPTPGTAVDGVFTPNVSWNGSVFLTATAQDTVSNTLAAISASWTTEGIIIASSTLAVRGETKYVAASGIDSAKFKAGVNEDHLSLLGVFAQRQNMPLRIFSNNSVQVGQLIEVAGWTRPQICSNGSYITTQFVEG